MKGYKGFEPGLICRGKQYAENTVFEEEEAEICSCGMHFCENPFDVLGYYGFTNDNGDFNEFAEVEALDEVKTDDNRKFCTKKLKIGAKLSISKFINACVDFAIEKTSTCIADNKISSGDFAQIGSSGNSAKIGSSGDFAQIGSSGNSAQIGSSGDSAKIGSSGDSAKIGSSGKDCVICCAGHNSVVKAKKGSWITLAEWEYSEEKERYIPKCVKTEFVDGERIKEDTLYKLIDGEFVEV
mgnify:CR=1 FL=1